jgi:hypothetical protein
MDRRALAGLGMRAQQGRGPVDVERRERRRGVHAFQAPKQIRLAWFDQA